MSRRRPLIDVSVASRLHARLREPAWPKSVRGSLPVLFFGDPPSSSVATLGINPSWQEYLHPASKGEAPGRELDGPARRFETLLSLGASGRADLSDVQCDVAVETMRGYFDVDRPVYPWFDHLKRVLGGMHLSYTDGAVAHLDVVQEATWPAWSGTKAAKELQPEIAQDSEFLRWELETFPISLVLANGRTPWNWLCKETQASDIKGERATQWLEWMVGRGTLLGREAWVAGWTQALHQPTGLGNKGESALGEKLATELSNLGYVVPVR